MKARVVAGVLGCAVLAIGMAFSQTTVPPAQGEKPVAGDQEQSFGRKVLLVRGKDASGSRYLLHNAKVRKLGDRYYLYGEGDCIVEKDTITLSAAFWIHLPDVNSIIDFSDYQQAIRTLPNVPHR